MSSDIRVTGMTKNGKPYGATIVVCADTSGEFVTSIRLDAPVNLDDMTEVLQGMTDTVMGWCWPRIGRGHSDPDLLFRRAYQITSVKGLTYGRSDLRRYVRRQLRRWYIEDDGTLDRRLDDPAWMRFRTGSVPHSIARDIAKEIEGSKEIEGGSNGNV